MSLGVLTLSELIESAELEGVLVRSANRIWPNERCMFTPGEAIRWAMTLFRVAVQEVAPVEEPEPLKHVFLTLNSMLVLLNEPGLSANKNLIEKQLHARARLLRLDYGHSGAERTYPITFLISESQHFKRWAEAEPIKPMKGQS